jgi:acyl-CoA thioesterase
MADTREADLLAADRFAGWLGIRLVSAEETRVEVAMTVRPEHVDGSGMIRAGVAFTVADCAMSLISNGRTRAFAVSAHLTGHGAAVPGGTLTAIATPAHHDRGRATWLVAVSAGGVTVATFTGTTLEVPALSDEA